MFGYQSNRSNPASVDPAYIVVDGKTKRVKQVFSNAQLCHVWSQQNQDYGRNAKDSLYFRGDSIYSYGSHFLAAKIFTLKSGERIALVNSKNYSMATSGHLGDIRQALSGLMKSYRVPNPSEIDHINNVNYFYNNVYDAISSAFSTIKVTTSKEIEYELDRIQNKVDAANTYFNLIGVKPIEVDSDTLEAIKAHYDYRFTRYQELNTPEMIAKKEAANALKAAKKADKEQKARELRNADDLKKLEGWKQGLPVSFPSGMNLKYDLVRVVGAAIETSRGAKVPKKEGITFYKAILSGKAKIGDGIGSFTFKNVFKTIDDTIIKVGCHTFSLNEIKSVMDQFCQDSLKLVGENNADQDDCVSF